MRLSELSGKEIVDVNRAERLGILGQTDLEIDETGQITSLIIPSVKWFGLLRNGSEIRVPWEHIKKIGADMVIIDFQEGLSNNDGEHMDG
ncbi:YlmC/YmxH family sporulation protein [Bacillus sp. ISL-34]|uniref:YlmC/YmxH family sporulation protein n=1 Tax=Bacillus sp. ISL-34 TaxID=2819121 RepID=UPI001BEAB8A4|nr:YlmC/YmxH family sporulation protein [Bacillus sp. ISL-34]MBT2649566.1 YlmC/YmxH family sporulation protein [Bacillus sp. ISL-34]